MKFINKVRGFIPDKHHIYCYLHGAFHCTYLGAVFIEAHGMYGYAAGALLIVVIAGFFLGVGE